MTRFIKEWADANGTGIWKMPEPAGWKPPLRSAAILAAGSGGFQPPVSKTLSRCTRTQPKPSTVFDSVRRAEGCYRRRGQWPRIVRIQLRGIAVGGVARAGCRARFSCPPSLASTACWRDKTPIKSASLSKWWAWFKKPAGPRRQVMTFNFPGPCKKLEFF